MKIRLYITALLACVSAMLSAQEPVADTTAVAVKQERQMSEQEAAYWAKKAEKHERRKSKYFDAFQHLGVGVEAGLMGFGVEVSMPVIDKKLVGKVGVNFGHYSLNEEFGINAYPLAAQIDELESQANSIGYPANLERIPPIVDKVDVDVNAKANLFHVKAMVEYYPLDYKTFHLVGGFMFGPTKFVELTGDLNGNTRQAHEQAIKLNTQLQKEYGLPGVKVDELAYILQYNIDGKTYSLGAEDMMNASINVWAVRPYVGWGVGRSIPNHRLGVQFEMGTWLMGFKKGRGTHVQAYDANAQSNRITDFVSGFPFCPQMTVRLTGHIF